MKLRLFVTLLLAASAFAQCDSYRAADGGDWKPIKTAPHDGTVVEIVETYGVAPWYGLFKWTDQMPAEDIWQCSQINGSAAYGPANAATKCAKGYRLDKWHRDAHKTEARWVSVDDPNSGVDDNDRCLFWRPYGRTGKYVDPTGGAQNSVEYWCRAIHRPYNKKRDRCE